MSDVIPYIPPALTGSAFVRSIAGFPLGPRREAAILAALESRVAWPTTEVRLVDESGTDRGCFTVADDYFAIGVPGDLVRTPCDAPTCQTIADRLGAFLPTPRLVDRIWAAAPIKLRPILRAPGPAMISVPWFVEHSAACDAAIGGREGLRSGHKKDVVIGTRLATHPHMVEIYGEITPGDLVLDHKLHRGEAIQPDSTAHEATYADESHGLRLCWGLVIDGAPRDFHDLVQSDDFALISHERLSVTRYPC